MYLTKGQVVIPKGLTYEKQQEKLSKSKTEKTEPITEKSSLIKAEIRSHQVKQFRPSLKMWDT